ncbi:MAG: methyltransferase domain-containing protein [Pseudomonadota bacterium]
MDDTAAYRRGNKAAWDASAPAHGSGEGWEKLLADAALPGFSELDETLTATLRSLDLRGKRAVQVCCNNARELLSLPSLGIEPVLGIDQSGAFLAQGAALSAAAGRELRLVEADVYALPEGLGTYDLALITIGVLNWMPDLPGFFRAVAGLVAPGGRLVIYETHPILEMVDPEGEDPHALAFSYFDKDPIEVPEMIVYDGAPTVASGAMGYWFVHTMGEIVTACIAAGFVLERLEEHRHSNREPDYDKYEGQEAQLPLCYTLVARRAGA